VTKQRIIKREEYARAVVEVGLSSLLFFFLLSPPLPPFFLLKFVEIV